MIPYDVTRACRNPRFRSWSPVFKIDCRRNIVKDNKREQIMYRPRASSVRRVPAFTIQSEQKSTRPFTPKKLYPQSTMNTSENEAQFIKFYNDRVLPIRIVSSAVKKDIEWLVNPMELNRNEKVELFCRLSVGLPIEIEPYTMVALRGFEDVLSLPDAAFIVASSLTNIIPHIRKSLFSLSSAKRIRVLELLRQLASLNGVGPLLVPFYRTLLPPLRRNGDLWANDRYRQSVAATLQTLERTGGRHAFINIKYVLPDYQTGGL